MRDADMLVPFFVLVVLVVVGLAAGLVVGLTHS